MKVLLISTHARRGGAAIATHRLMGALREFGVDTGMLVQQGGEKEDDVYPTTRSVIKKWINLYRFILERLVFVMRERDRRFRFLFSPAGTGESIHGNTHVKEADIIHLHWINAGFLSLRSLKFLLRSGKPVVWTFHDMWAFTGGCHYALECKGYTVECGHCPFLRKPSPGDLSNRVWKRKEKAFRNARFAVITPSRWLEGCVRSSSLLGHLEVHAIHNPVDPQQFRPIQGEEACRILGIEPGRKYILFGAANVNNFLKGFDHFVEAIRLLRIEMMDDREIEILLFGKVSGDITGRFPFRTHIIPFTGNQLQIRAIYSAARVFVIPSLQDNLPNTIIESQLCGTPVVGFRNGGIPEMIEHLVDGYLADPGSERDLAEGMKWALGHSDHEALSEAARRMAVERYPVGGSVEKHMEVYRKMLDR